MTTSLSSRFGDKGAIQSMTLWGLLLTFLGFLTAKYKLPVEADQLANYASYALAALGTLLSYLGYKRLSDSVSAYKSLTVRGLLVMLIMFAATKFKLGITEEQAGSIAVTAIAGIGFIAGGIGRMRRGGITGLLKPEESSR